MPHGTWTRDLDGWVEKKLSLSIQHFFWLARAFTPNKTDESCTWCVVLRFAVAIEVCQKQSRATLMQQTNVCVCVPDACTLWIINIIIIIIHHTVFCCWWMHPAN